MTKYFVIISSTLYVNHSSGWCLFNGSYKTWYTKINSQLAMLFWYQIYPCCSPLSLVISNEQGFRKLFLPWLSCRSWQDKPSTSRYQATCGTQNSNSRRRREISSHEKRFKQKSFKMIWTNARKNVNTHKAVLHYLLSKTDQPWKSKMPHSLIGDDVWWLTLLSLKIQWIKYAILIFFTWFCYNLKWNLS